MKILLVNYEYPPLGGGGGIETKDLAEELAKRHQVTVLTTRYRSLPKYERVSENIAIRRVAVLGRRELPTATVLSLVTFFPSALWQGFFLMRSKKFDIVNAHFALPSGVPAKILARVFSVPFVITLIGGDLYDPSKGISPHRHYLLKKVVAWVVSGADRVTAISSDTMNRARDYYGVKSEIDVIPLGFVPPKSGRVRDLGGGKDHYCAVGRLVPRKGYFDMVKAFARYAGENAVLHIVGDGPLRQDIEAEAVRLGMRQRLVMHGRVDDEEKFAVMRGSSVFISASHHEGFGICFLEAMHAGLPIIATNVGGQNDFLKEGENALLVPPENEAAMGQAIGRLQKDHALRAEMARRNKEKVNGLTIEETARRYEDIFLKALKK